MKFDVSKYDMTNDIVKETLDIKYHHKMNVAVFKGHGVHMNIQLILTILNQNLMMKQQRTILMKTHLIIPTQVNLMLHIKHMNIFVTLVTTV